MAKKDIILSEANREVMPECLQSNVYYAGNDPSVQAEWELKQVIIELVKEYEPWQVQLCRRFASGEPQAVIGASLKKTESQMRYFLTSAPGKFLTSHFVHLSILEDGLPRKVRKAMLERIAVDNEKSDPKESIRAISELEKIAAATQAVGGFTVVINGVELVKGALDG